MFFADDPDDRDEPAEWDTDLEPVDLDTEPEWFDDLDDALDEDEVEPDLDDFCCGQEDEDTDG